MTVTRVYRASAGRRGRWRAGAEGTPGRAPLTPGRPGAAAAFQAGRRSWTRRGSGAGRTLVPAGCTVFADASGGGRAGVGRTARLGLGYQTRHRTCGCMGVPRAQWNALAKAAKFCSEPSTLRAEGGA